MKTARTKKQMKQLLAAGMPVWFRGEQEKQAAIALESEGAGKIAESTFVRHRRDSRKFVAWGQLQPVKRPARSKSASSAEHYFVLRPAKPDAFDPSPQVFGVSSWDMPDGDRLHREMIRSTRLHGAKEIVRWGRKWADVTEQHIDSAVSFLLNNDPRYLAAQAIADNEDAQLAWSK